MRIAINDFISGRGASGSAIGGRAIVDALKFADHDCRKIAPAGYRAGRRLANMAEMLRWDYHLAEKAAVDVKADLMINLANTGVGRRVPTINVLHDTMVLDHRAMFDFGYRAYAKATFGPSVRSAVVNVVPSEHSKTQAEKRWPGANFKVIGWSSPNPRVTTSLRAPRSHNVVAIASADRHKRLPLLINAVNQARIQSGCDLTLTMIARGGNSMSELADLVARRNLPWVKLVTEYVQQPDLQNLIDSSFCIASSSLDEGFCLPLLEAGLRGIPVVHTARGAMSEVVSVNPRIPVSNIRNDLDFLSAQLEALVRDSVWAEEALRAWKASLAFDEPTFRISWSGVVEYALQNR